MRAKEEKEGVRVMLLPPGQMQIEPRQDLQQLCHMKQRVTCIEQPELLKAQSCSGSQILHTKPGASESHSNKFFMSSSSREDMSLFV